jgi:hypothetical protein
VYVPGIAPRGYLHVATDVSTLGRPDVEGVLMDEARRAHRESPVADIIAVDDDGVNGLLVSTTTEHLAHRLGRALYKKFGGELHHGFGRRNSLALVWWRHAGTTS